MVTSLHASWTNNDPECNLKRAKFQTFLGEHIFRLPAFGNYQILKLHNRLISPKIDR